MLRYERQGKCNRCGWCCLQEDPPCPYLKKEEDGKYICEVFNDPGKRYKRCYLYPEQPPIIYDGCGYWFVDRFDNNKKVKRVVT